MMNSVQQMSWDSKPDLQPCWSIWAPAPKQSLSLSPRLTPPREQGRFWPREPLHEPLRESRVVSEGARPSYLHSPPCLYPASDFEPVHGLNAQNTPSVPHGLPRSPPLTPKATTVCMAPLLGDRSYLIDCQGPLYIVQFKGNRSEVFTAAQGIEHYEGELVIVDADRGQDLGRISKAKVSRDFAGQLRLKQHEERAAILAACGSKEPATAAAPFTPNNILRSATNDEINQLSQKLADENKAVALCCQKVKDRGLDMTVLGAEFQWDRRKLTFFYQAGHRIDFRDLVRELFRIYKTRIWMCAVASD